MRRLLRLVRLLDLLPTWLLRAAHDVGLAAWFGGAYMGAVALNGASIEVDEPTQRSRVANAGWFRWAAIVPVAVGLHVVGSVGLTRRHPGGGAAVRGVGVVRIGMLGAALAATAQSGRWGRAVAAAGDVPVTTAVTPTSETPPEVADAQRRLHRLQWVIPAVTGAIIVVDAWQQQHGGTAVGRVGPRGPRRAAVRAVRRAAGIGRPGGAWVRSARDIASALP